MNYDSFKKQYIEYRRDLKSIPNGTSTYKKIHKQLDDLLNEVKLKFGQEIVDEITGFKRK